MPKYNIGKTARIMLSKDNTTMPGILLNLIALADRKNLIHLNGHLKSLIIKKCDIKTASYFDVSLDRYIGQGYLVRIAESTYMLNPHCAFKCSNQEYVTLVDVYEMRVKEALVKQVNRLKLANKKLKDEVTGEAVIASVNRILNKEATS